MRMKISVFCRVPTDSPTETYHVCNSKNVLFGNMALINVMSYECDEQSPPVHVTSTEPVTDTIQVL